MNDVLSSRFSRPIAIFLISLLAQVLWAQPNRPDQHKNQDALFHIILKNEMSWDTCPSAFIEVFENNGNYVFAYTCSTVNDSGEPKPEFIKLGYLSGIKLDTTQTPLSFDQVSRISNRKIRFRNNFYIRIIAANFARYD